MELLSLFLDFFNIIVVLLIFFNLFNILKIFYKKSKINQFYGNNYRMIPDDFGKRTLANKLSMYFWGFAFILSLVSWISKSETSLDDPFISIEYFTFLALSMAVLRYFDNGPFSETKIRANIFYNETNFTLNPFNKLVAFRKYDWNEIDYVDFHQSSYSYYIDIFIYLMNKKEYRLVVEKDDENKFRELFKNKKVKINKDYNEKTNDK